MEKQIEKNLDNEIEIGSLFGLYLQFNMLGCRSPEVICNEKLFSAIWGGKVGCGNCGVMYKIPKCKCIYIYIHIYIYECMYRIHICVQAHAYMSSFVCVYIYTQRYRLSYKYTVACPALYYHQTLAPNP